MNEITPPTDTAELEQRIRLWMQDHPDRAHAGERMLVQLSRIKREFDGKTAARLETLVFETLERQLRIDEARKTGLAAAKRLAESVQKLTQTMAQCLVSAQSARTAVKSTMDRLAEQATPGQTISYVAPALPAKAIDRKLMN